MTSPCCLARSDRAPGRSRERLLPAARVTDLDAFPFRPGPDAQVARRTHRVRRGLDDRALVPGLAVHRVVRLQLELLRLLVEGAGLGDADRIRARDARGLVLMGRGVVAGPRQRRERRAVQRALDL